MNFISQKTNKGKVLNFLCYSFVANCGGKTAEANFGEKTAQVHFDNYKRIT